MKRGREEKREERVRKNKKSGERRERGDNSGEGEGGEREKKILINKYIHYINPNKT